MTRISPRLPATRPGAALGQRASGQRWAALGQRARGSAGPVAGTRRVSKLCVRPHLQEGMLQEGSESAAPPFPTPTSAPGPRPSTLGPLFLVALASLSQPVVERAAEEENQETAATLTAALLLLLGSPEPGF